MSQVYNCPKFWPLDTIKARVHDDEVFDNLFLPTSEEKTEPNAIFDVIQAFLDDVVFEQGYSLGDTSRRRFGLYVASHVNAGVIVNPTSLAVMFDRCFELGIFKNDSGTEFNEGLPRIKAVVEQPPRVTPPVEQPHRENLVDLDAIDTSTRDGLRRAQNLAETLYVEEMLPLAAAWVSSIQRHWGFSPTPDDMRRVSNWFSANNLNRLDARNYDAARRWLVSSGYWPESCLTATDKFNLSLENIDTSRLTVQQRNELNRRELQARESDAARFGR